MLDELGYRNVAHTSLGLCLGGRSQIEATNHFFMSVPNGSTTVKKKKKVHVYKLGYPASHIIGRSHFFK